MNPLYNACIGLYRLGASAAALRSGKVKEMLRGQRDTLEQLESVRKEKAPDGFDVWVHAASLGEFEQGRPIIERLRREHPEKTILLTFFSPSGYRVRKDYGQVDHVAYLPFDTPSFAKRFMEAARPRMAIFVKYEFWGNYLEELKRRGVPTYIISAIFRPGQAFFKPWGGEFRKMLGCFTHLYLQDENSKELLRGIGITNTTVAGDTRFDRVTDIRRAAKDVAEIERFMKGPEVCIVAGSTWEPDEAILAGWLKRHKEAKAIIAPHEFDEARLRELERRLGEGTVRLSALQKGEAPAEGARVVIADCFGLLSSLYRYGQIAYVGGGYGAGIHNINEAAVYGVPVVFGPRHEKFKEAADLIALGGGFDNPEILEKLYEDSEFRENAGKIAGKYIKDNIGASEKIYSEIF